MTNQPKTTRTFNLISAILAFLLWGGWAFYINSQNSMRTGIISGLGQGTASFLITLFMVRVVARIYHRIHQPVLKLFLPAVLTVSLTSLCLVIIHTLLGTPHILKTILPALTVAFIFCLYTSFQLQRISKIGTEPL